MGKFEGRVVILVKIENFMKYKHVCYGQLRTCVTRNMSYVIETFL